MSTGSRDGVLASMSMLDGRSRLSESVLWGWRSRHPSVPRRAGSATENQTTAVTVLSGRGGLSSTRAGVESTDDGGHRRSRRRRVHRRKVMRYIVRRSVESASTDLGEYLPAMIRH